MSRHETPTPIPHRKQELIFENPGVKISPTNVTVTNRLDTTLSEGITAETRTKSAFGLSESLVTLFERRIYRCERR